MDKLVESVYWSIEVDSESNHQQEQEEQQQQQQKEHFISLSGNLMQIEEDYLVLERGVLEENSSKNLIKLFTAEAIEAALSSPNDPLRNLVESLVLLAQVNLSKKEEGGCSGERLEIYFTSSVLIGGKVEYPLYILDKRRFEGKAVVLEAKSIDEAAELVHQYYETYEKADETEIFVDSRIFDHLAGISKESELFDKMIKSLRESGLQLKDLSEEIIDVPLDEINDDFAETMKKIKSSLTPSEKLIHLAEFYSKLSSRTVAINADILLPLLTALLVRSGDGNLIDQLRFIEKFVHPSKLTGANNYMLTSMDASIEVIRTLYRKQEENVRNENDKNVNDQSSSIEKDKRDNQSSSLSSIDPQVIPSSPSHFSSFISSITSVPKTLVSNMGLIGGRTALKNEVHHGDLIFEMTEFRERMMATNSEKDLCIRDVSLLLEDYKNLLFKIFK